MTSLAGVSSDSNKPTKGGKAEPLAIEVERRVKRDIRWWDVVSEDEVTVWLLVWVWSQVGRVEGVDVRVDAA